MHEARPHSKCFKVRLFASLYLQNYVKNYFDGTYPLNDLKYTFLSYYVYFWLLSSFGHVWNSGLSYDFTNLSVALAIVWRQTVPYGHGCNFTCTENYCFHDLCMKYALLCVWIVWNTGYAVVCIDRSVEFNSCVLFWVFGCSNVCWI